MAYRYGGSGPMVVVILVEVVLPYRHNINLSDNLKLASRDNQPKRQKMRLCGQGYCCSHTDQRVDPRIIVLLTTN